MALATFDDPAVQAAMRAYLDACAAVEAAAETSQVLDLSDRKAVAGMQLRKRLVEAGWTAPVAQRSTT